MNKIFLSIAFFLSSFMVINAQDNHYEALQLGAKNSILSGATISKWQDPTAVFQNPATLSQTVGNSISFNTAAFTIYKVKLENNLGDKYTKKSSSTRFLPSLVGGDFRANKGESDWVWGYAIYHRNRDNLRFTNRIENNQNIINDAESPGNENYVGQSKLETEFDETAGVFGFGKKLNDRWSFGASFNGIFRTQDYRNAFTGNAIPDPANNPSIDLVASNSDIDVTYSKALAQLKFGLAYQHNGWNIGLTVMTPSVGIYGSGEIVADISLTNIKLPQNTGRKNYIASTRLAKMKPTFKYPLNVAGGITRQFTKIQLSAAATWYAPISKYVMLDPGDAVFVRPPSDQNVLATKNFLQVWSVNNSVVNVSFSADWILKSNLHLLFGYALDQAYSEDKPEEPGFQLATKFWDLTHLNAGVQFIRAKSNWIIGFQSAFGKNSHYRQPRSLDGPTEENFLQGHPNMGIIKYTSTGIIISYSLKFGK